jgi:TatD DNase family protein
MTELIDTHCHIQSAGRQQGGERITQALWARSPQLSRDKLVSSARENNVTRLIVVGCDLDDSQLATTFAQSQKNCWAAIGVHPHEAQHYAGSEPLKQQLAELATQEKVVAVGECGLDYYYEHSPKSAQIEMLRYQIELALKTALPLIFHVREAFDDFWPVFDSYQNIRGVLHSFTDNATNLDKALQRKLMIGVNGIATFTKDPKQLDVYRTIPVTNLLLETDAPFLSPAPLRGRVNEPKQIKTIAEFLVNLRGTNLRALSTATTANARQLFGI